MQPEQGDKSVCVTRADMAEALRAVGIEPGETFFFHSALRSVGTMEGGADALIDGCLDAVGPEGTVGVPTLCNWEPEEKHLVFERWDPASTPSYVGKITEVFRNRAGAMRSDHATHSVAAIGRRAEELTKNHGASGLRAGPFGPRAFAVESPWERLVAWDAAYGFIGVTLRVCTLVHYVETLLVERALQRAPEGMRSDLEKEVVGWEQEGVWPQIRPKDREVHQETLAEQGLIHMGKIGSATLRWIRSKALCDAWIELLEKEPERWFPAAYCEWLSRIP